MFVYLFFSSSFEKSVILGDSTFSCCDLTDTSGNPMCTIKTTRSGRSTGAVVYGHNRPLTNGANYSYYIVTATPVRSASGTFRIIYTSSPSQDVTYQYGKLNVLLPSSQVYMTFLLALPGS